MKLFKAIVAVAALLSLGAVQAQTITGEDIKQDYENSTENSFSVLASNLSGGVGTLGLKSQDGYTGVGVQGTTNGEIDWRNGRSESITLTFTAPTNIGSFTLGLLFNGPEYNDVREVAHITVNGDQSYFLRTSGTENLASWWLGNTALGDVSFIGGAGTQSGQGGAITLSNPFGNLAVNTITFAASEGFSGGGCGGLLGACTNQSDYNVISVTAVPEPGTYALMLAGLGAVAFMARRRRPTV